MENEAVICKLDFYGFEFGIYLFIFFDYDTKLADEETGVENMSEDINGETYNWPRFCEVLGEKGPDLLTGVDKKVIDTFIRDQARQRVPMCFILMAWNMC